MSKRLKRANRLDACAAIILGEDERTRDVVSLRDLDSGAQDEIPRPELEARLARYR